MSFPLFSLLLVHALAGGALVPPSGSPAPGSAPGRSREEARREVLISAVERRFVTATVRVPEAEVERFYEAHRAEFAGSERLVLRHLFRRLSARASASAREVARAELEELRRQILAGADLAALAQAQSDSQSARFGGLIAPQARGQLEPSVEARVWRLSVGELSEVVETPIGFHIFRLEQRLPPQNIDPATAREVSRSKLTLAATTAARERLFDQLVRESGALWAPQLLESAPAPSALLFELGAERWTVADLERAIAELPFLEQRTLSPLALLRARAARTLYLFHAEREHLAETAELVQVLAEAERAAQREEAAAAFLAERREQLTDADLLPLFESRPERFAAPARHRLRILVRDFTPAHSPHYYFEELTALAAEIRAGRRDFAAAARELSSDRSAAQGGDLGWIDLRDFGWWAGTRAYERVQELVPGAVSEPLLVEVYDGTELKDRARGYVLVRVEASEPRRARSFSEARSDIAAAWIEDHRPALQREIEARLSSETLAKP